MKTICALIYYLATKEIISACIDFKFLHLRTQYTKFIITLFYHMFFFFIEIQVIILP